MTKDIPMEWVDKLFICMEQFYGARWTKGLDKAYTIAFYKTTWKSALYGLTYDEIKNTLKYLKRAAQHPAALPPHPLEFWKYAKGVAVPHIDYSEPEGTCNPEVAQAALNEIHQKLHGHNRRNLSI